ncbi:unnamed protein product [Linum tenue]|uniref:Uncharacterized protein n=1 Tax=Linum tenue TaxID=586396 RepID=A0AAV0RXT3_9ROSI|nr:unnamed protein product [Linum tenue]
MIHFLPFPFQFWNPSLSFPKLQSQATPQRIQFPMIDQESNKAMESTQKLQFLTDEIQKLAQEKKKKKKKKNQEEEEVYGDSIPLDDKDRPILSRLLSELESLKGEGTLKQPGSPRGGEGRSRNRRDSKKTDADEELVKEIRKVKRQNFITHCLLSALIVVTVGWQVSEVSIALAVKDKLSHPVRSLLSSFFPGRVRNEQDGERKQSAEETDSGSTINMPELPCVDFGLTGDK